MDYQFSLTVNELKSFQLIANHKDSMRYYLQGINVQYIPETKKLCFVATDGHRMLVKMIDAPETMNSDFQSFIIPAKTIKTIITGLKGNEYVNFRNWIINGVMTHKAGNLEFSPVDGKYPDWRIILSVHCKGETAQFNPAYVGDFGKISKFLGKKTGYIHIHHNESGSPAYIDLGNPEYFGVLMPVRSEPDMTLNAMLENISDSLNLKWSIGCVMQVSSIAA